MELLGGLNTNNSYIAKDYHTCIVKDPYGYREKNKNRRIVLFNYILLLKIVSFLIITAH